MKYVNGEYYHVFNRGANKSRIFYTANNYRYCLNLLCKYSLKYAVSILAYCLMPNHYHLVCRQDPGGSISKFLRDAFNAYSQALNNERSHSGTLFEGRAKGKHIYSDSYVVQVVRYIHLNPVEGGLVVRPEDWKFSDYTEWRSEPCEGAEPSQGYLLRDAYFKNEDSYREFVETYLNREDVPEMVQYLFDE